MQSGVTLFQSTSLLYKNTLWSPHWVPDCRIKTSRSNRAFRWSPESSFTFLPALSWLGSEHCEATTFRWGAGIFIAFMSVISEKSHLSREDTIKRCGQISLKSYPSSMREWSKAWFGHYLLLVFAWKQKIHRKFQKAQTQIIRATILTRGQGIPRYAIKTFPQQTKFFQVIGKRAEHAGRASWQVFLRWASGLPGPVTPSHTFCWKDVILWNPADSAAWSLLDT